MTDTLAAALAAGDAAEAQIAAGRADALYGPAIDKMVTAESDATAVIDEAASAACLAYVHTLPALRIFVAVAAAEAHVVIGDARRDAIVAAIVDDLDSIPLVIAAMLEAGGE